MTLLTSIPALVLTVAGKPLGNIHLETGYEVGMMGSRRVWTDLVAA